MNIQPANKQDNSRVTFKNNSVFNTVSNIESNILLNKGITDLGGFVIPQAVMSNNKDESIERVFKSLLYFGITFVSPLFLLPLINKGALSHFKIVNNFKNDEKKILQVSKKYLTKDGKYLQEGIKLKAKELFGDENKFNSIIDKYSDLEKLRKDLINSHTTVLFSDFLLTNLMVASIPWLGNMLTKYRTNRSGYSGTYQLADEEFTRISAEKHAKTKTLRQAATFALAVLPAMTIPFMLKKGMLNGAASKNNLLKWFNNNADKFDYKDSIYMSRLTALAMWITSDYFPYQLACRDKYEYRDTLIRGTSIGLVFWGGDLLLKRAFSKLSDKIFKTNLMNKSKNRPYALKELKNYQNINELKNLSLKTIKRTQNAGVGLYVLNLGIIMATLGFGLPAVLNRFLRRKVDEDKMHINSNNCFQLEFPDVYKSFKFK